MPLKGRVGRHANTGKQCQNWRDDQQTVIALLNRIPIADGGAEGTLKPPVVAGYAAEGLYTSILYYQKKQFPSAQTGYVDPSGPVLAKLQSLASQPPPPPAKAGQWDNIKSGSVDKALRTALADDLKIDHGEAVDIIRATLSNGIVRPTELEDLTTIATTSHKHLAAVEGAVEGFRFLCELRLLRQRAVPTDLGQASVCRQYGLRFSETIGLNVFPKLDRDKVGLGLLMRIANPGMMHQGDSSLCGPDRHALNLASDQPGARTPGTPSTCTRRGGDARPGPDRAGQVGPQLRAIGLYQWPVDWLTAASLRDSENWFFGYDTVERGIRRHHAARGAGRLVQAGRGIPTSGMRRTSATTRVQAPSSTRAGCSTAATASACSSTPT